MQGAFDNRDTFSINSIFNVLSNFPLLTYVISFLQDFIIGVLNTGPIPKHIAIIMDGNRRYAKQNNLALKDGHTAGAEALVNVLDVCFRTGVEHVTIYAFSIENFNRSKEEVDTLFSLLRDKLKMISEHEDSYARFNKIRVRIIGNKSYIPTDILQDLESIEETTKNATSKKTLNVCFPYTTRDEIVYSIKSIINKVNNGEIESKDKIDSKIIADNFYFGPDTPPLDILIRTSGHTRLSDFLLWQSNYNSTIEFVDTLWPEFKFFAMTSILLKWSYYRTLQLEALSIMGAKNEDDLDIKINLLKQLPKHPPYASVNSRQVRLG
ncbi:cis-prenyltransferase [Scheffersomyces amazonensis]|uniref:cis-prenyltransferase n=1 Tax=Scheffersomyces amazonensis TaxID=1078765 RepID=UPI00315D176C